LILTNTASSLALEKVAAGSSARAKTAMPAQPNEPITIFMRFSRHSLEELINPYCPAWKEAASQKVPLYKQNLVVPFGGGSIKELSVQSLKIKEGVLFRLEWQDSTKDNDTVHQVKFRDAAAIEFPIGPVQDTVLSMGSPHGPVNIWQWKADWEHDAPVMATSPYEKNEDKTNAQYTVVYKRLAVDSAREQEAAQGKNGPTSILPNNLFPQSAHSKSPVEDIIAIGISSVSTKPEPLQALKGKGDWKDGVWHVVIFKPNNTRDPNSPQFEDGQKQNLAFAVWNGSQQDRNGMKSISNWATLICPAGGKK
jgi:DMSO reductase family type II enzyme heme b subunit